ncbi:MAG: sigma-70 family RNA polymerase sigma factor [Planctomycetes bacterium]|nr:sigma-70 family RNA polymerase sigma factor [Planctomycetota bacterium]
MSLDDVTRILERHREGNDSVLDQLLPILYEELRALARSQLKRRSPNQTLQPTALVHEAYARLVAKPEGTWTGRGHFLAVAATAMRQILIDYARGKNTGKRGSGWQRVTLSECEAAKSGPDFELLALDEALSDLALMDERKARIVECRFLGGMTVEEIAEALGVSATTVERDWRVARAWLGARLQGDIQS